MKTILKAIVLCLPLVVISCNGDSDRKRKMADNRGLEVITKVSVGEVYSDYNTLDVPTFFNVGEIQSQEGGTMLSIVYGEKLKVNSKTKAMPVALFSFVRNDKQEDYLVARSSVDSIKMENAYLHFMTHEAGVQSLIENWFVNQCPLGECKEFRWSNAYKAYLALDTEYLKEKG